MKKLFASILALAMVSAMSATAFATEIDQDSTTKAGNTQVKLSVDPAYIVTIPADVTLTLTGDSYAGSGEITAKEVRIGKDQAITVTVASNNNFVLTSGENATLPYTLQIGNTALPASNVVASFTTDTAEQTVTLNYSAQDPEFAGVYRDTLTFTISAPAVSDPAANN